MSYLLRVRIAWVMLIAMTFGAIAPALAHELKHKNNRLLLEICTSQGPKQIALDLSEDSSRRDQIPDEHPSNTGSDCPFCFLSQDTPILLATDLPSASRTTVSNTFNSQARLPLPRLLWFQTGHLSRAPPAIS